MNPENPKIKPLKKYWVCVDKDGESDAFTIAGNKEHSIELWNEDRDCPDLNLFEKEGYKCIQVDISFNPVKK